MEVATVCSSELTPAEERMVIRDLTLAAQAHCKEGDTFYLIAHRWWQNWLDYVYQDHSDVSNSGNISHGLQSQDFAATIASKRPSLIDNTELIYELTSEIELHDTLAEGRDFILLPQEVWRQLLGWYGGGPTLSRKVISSGISQSELSVEVYPLRLQLLLEPKGEHAFIRISKKETVGELHRKACEIFDLGSDQVSIWDYYGHQKHALMNSMEKTLDDSNIQMDQEILVEVLGDGITGAYDGCMSYIQENGHVDKDLGSVITEPGRSSLPNAGGLSASKNASRSCSSDLSQNQILGSPTSDLDNSHSNNTISIRGASVGLTGLLNLGNTCFMNSAIQCLVHTPEFARYFREDYRQEINWQNPLGMVGELALAFGELLRKLWAPGRTPINPRPFKTKLARFAPQFSGYNQHDSQELLAFLLDGLHEDLNRVKDKPYMNTRDAEGRSDEEVADDHWQNHIARNNSIIVDVCQGQYKSTLVCPVCGKVSVTFDPFMYLSLPLQFATARSMTVTVLTGDGSALPAPYTVSVPKHGRCKDLIQILGTACSLKVGEKLLLAEVRGHSIHRFLTDPLILLSTIKDEEHVVAYKIPNIESSTVILQLIHQREERELHSKAMIYKPFGIPLVTQVSIDDISKKGSIQSIARKMLSPMLRSEKAQALSDHKSYLEVAEVSSSEISVSKEQDSEQSVTYSLPLHFIDGTGQSVDLSACEEESVEVSSSLDPLSVYFNWSAEDFEWYNTRCLENLPEVFKYGAPLKKARNEPLSLYACLEAFLREEPLVPEDMWFCPQCKERRQASKKLDLWRLPEVLVIHLKRFSYSRSNKHKLETFVNFPIHDFDLTSYVANKNSSQRQLYELYALSNHYGNMASGHYTAHIKLLDENRWYNFDDNHIMAINEEEVKSPAAYVLFYRRVKDEDASLSYGAPCSLEQNHHTSRR